MPDRDEKTGLMDEVLTIRMHTKVTKGGRNLSFAALVAVGNGNGKVGLGYGKAPGVPMAIDKATKDARDKITKIPLIGDTVCHEQIGEHKSSEVIIKPAAPGTGVKAGGTVRSIMQVLGVHNVLTKSLGRNNPLNLAKATMNALESLRSKKEVERLRQREISLRHPQLDRASPEESSEQEDEEKPQETSAEKAESPQETSDTEESEQTPDSQQPEETEALDEESEMESDIGEEEEASKEKTDTDTKQTTESDEEKQST
ncbi:MAG: 30S ribosomal protein S5 [Candidatus Brocadiia bacterium]